MTVQWAQSRARLPSFSALQYERSSKKWRPNSKSARIHQKSSDVLSRIHQHWQHHDSPTVQCIQPKPWFVIVPLTKEVEPFTSSTRLRGAPKAQRLGANQPPPSVLQGPLSVKTMSIPVCRIPPIATEHRTMTMLSWRSSLRLTFFESLTQLG